MRKHPNEQPIVDSLPAFVWIYSRQDGSIWTNHSGKRFLYGEDDSLWPAESTFDYTSRIHPDDLQSSHSTMAEMIAHPDRDLTGRYRMRGADDQYHWLEFRMQPLCDNGAEPTHWVGLSHIIDSTMVQLQDLQLALDNERCEREQQARLLSMVQRKESAQHIASGIAHDLNNILQTILFSVESSALAGSGKELQSRMAGIKQNIHKASRICQQFLSYERGQPQQCAHLNTSDFLFENLEVLRIAAGQETDFSHQLDTALAPIRVNPTELLNCLVNLVVNARDATGGRGSICLAASQSLDPANPGSGTIAIRVTDDGEGIAEDIQPHILHPFFTTKPIGKGSGLGLAMVARFLENASGNLAFQSSPGKGTWFEIQLPIARVAPDQHDQKPLDGDFPGGHSVLIVEDNHELLATLQEFFKNRGWSTVAAFNIEHALRILDEGLTPDLVLSDINTPGRGRPIDLLQLPCCQDRRNLVFTTGHLHADDEMAMIASHAVPILQKPFSAEDLARAIRATAAVRSQQQDCQHN